jgi:hypothetical protein
VLCGGSVVCVRLPLTQLRDDATCQQTVRDCVSAPRGVRKSGYNSSAPTHSRRTQLSVGCAQTHTWEFTTQASAPFHFFPSPLVPSFSYSRNVLCFWQKSNFYGKYISCSLASNHPPPSLTPQAAARRIVGKL